MVRSLIAALALFSGISAAMAAAPIYGPLEAQNNLSEIAAGGVTAQSAAIKSIFGTFLQASASGLGGTDPNGFADGTPSILFNPALSHAQTVGVWFAPNFGTTSANSDFLTAYDLKFGDTGSPVPAGTLGNLGGYECNITTAQAASNVTEGPHCFGSTLVFSNGAPGSSSAETLTLSGTTLPAATNADHTADFNISNDLGTAGYGDGIYINSGGTSPANAAVDIEPGGNTGFYWDIVSGDGLRIGTQAGAYGLTISSTISGQNLNLSSGAGGILLLGAGANGSAVGKVALVQTGAGTAAKYVCADSNGNLLTQAGAC